MARQTHHVVPNRDGGWVYSTREGKKMAFMSNETSHIGMPIAQVWNTMPIRIRQALLILRWPYMGMRLTRMRMGHAKTTRTANKKVGRYPK